MGFPGITLDKDGDQVKGFLFSSEKISEHLSKVPGIAYDHANDLGPIKPQLDILRRNVFVETSLGGP